MQGWETRQMVCPWKSTVRNHGTLHCGFLINGLYSPDLPGLPTIVDDVDAVKGGDVQLVCEIEDPGNPEATSYVWKK